MSKQLTSEELEENMELVKKLFSLFGQERREKVEKMFEGPVGASYFLSPASSRVEFHSCYAGGLMVHSLGLVKHLRKLASALAPDRWAAEQLVFVGLFHDLGKVGDGVEDYYIPEESDWHRNRGMLYKINPRCIHMPTSERGLYILQKFDVKLTADEYLAIRLNDGMYDETNRNYRMKEPDLALLVHWADRWATSMEKE